MIPELTRGVVRDITPHMKTSSEETVWHEQIKEEEPEPEEPMGPTIEVDERVLNNKGRFNYPKTNEYPVFEGKPDEDWVNFIEIVNTVQSSYDLPDAEITSRLPTI